jgi:signal transduction protein with GAF and PtsI domain
VAESHVEIFSEICEVVAESRSPQQTLEAIVERVAHRFATDVCSVYLFDTQQECTR